MRTCVVHNEKERKLQKIVRGWTKIKYFSSCLIGKRVEAIPVVHEAVDHRVVHGVGHGQPVDRQIDLLKVIQILR